MTKKVEHWETIALLIKMPKWWINTRCRELRLKLDGNKRALAERIYTHYSISSGEERRNTLNAIGWAINLTTRKTS